MKIRNLAFASVSLLSLATPAFAQDHSSQSGDSVGSGEIIVTARRKEESAQDVPLVVNAVPAATLNKLNIRDFKDVATLVPGLTLTPAVDGLAPSATIRGVNYDVNSAGNNGTIQFYLNDAAIGGGALFQSMYDIGQIEVLRGPQGTLRGIAAPSGSVTITTRRPDLEEIGGYVAGTVNTIGGVNVNGAANLPIIKDVLAVRVAGIVSDDEANRVHSINAPGIEPYVHSRGERVSVRFTPITDLEINGTYQHYLNHTQIFDQVVSSGLLFGSPVVGTQIAADDREAVTGAPREVRAEYNQYNIQAQYKIAGQRLNYVGGWADQHISSQYRDDTGAAFAGFPGNAAADPIASPNLLNYGQNTQSRSNNQFHELRLSSDERLFGMLDYVVGGMINRSVSPTDLIINTPLFLGSPPTPANFATFFRSNISLRNRSLERSVYGNATVHLGDATEVSGGLRYIHFNNYSTLTLTNNGFSDFHTTVYQASIKHRFNENIMAYASTGSSWRIGAGTNGIILASSGNLVSTDPALAALNVFTPEKSKSYEVGIKTDWLDKRLHLNVTYYHQDYSNYIFFSSPILFQAFNGTAYSTSLSRSGLTTGVPVKVNGVEADFGFTPSRNFSVSGTASYSLGKITNGQVPCSINPAAPPAPPAQIALCTVNQRASPAAPFTATLQSEYSHDINANLAGFLRGQLTYYGKSQNFPENPYDDVKAYGLLNLFAGVHGSDDSNWEITAYVKNLFNVYRTLQVNASPYLATYGTTAGGGGAVVSNYNGINAATPPREFGVSFRYAFGSR